MSREQLLRDMKNCPQTDFQSVYDHGLSVKDYTFQLIEFLENDNFLNLKLPNWFSLYRSEILSSLYSRDIIEEYTIFHDCSKPYCLIYDSEGKRHFPNHAELSFQKWLEVGGNPQVANLMKMDMKIHLLKAAEVDDFIKNPEAITLLIVGLAEVYANAFGNYDSLSFKIKYKQIEKRGKTICQKLFGEK